jgi:hypothetical protein
VLLAVAAAPAAWRCSPRLVFGEQFGCRSPAGLILEIDVGQLLPGDVFHDKASFQFINKPGRRKAAGGMRLSSNQGIIGSP